MSPLFLKTIAKRNHILLLFLTLNVGLFANDTIPDLGFEAHCKSSDAYILYAYTDVTYTKAWRDYSRETSVQSKVIVNNRSGVERYAFLNMSAFVNSHLKTIEVNTLKADGTVMKLDSILVFGQLSDKKKQGVINYPIPGVEPGDTISFSYTYTERLNIHELKDFVNLYSELPSFNTEFSIKTPPSLKIVYKGYNDFPDPQVVSNDSLVYCLFRMQRIKGLEENKYTCLPCELPYVYYSVDKKKSKAWTWKQLYNVEYNFTTQPFLLDFENSSYYKRWKKRTIGDAVDSTKYYQLNLLIEDITNTMKIQPFNGDDFVKSSGYFLKNKYIDPVSIRRLYRQILEDLEIDFWAVFARSKRSGLIDPYYIRKGEYDHIFFAYEDELGALILLYPHNEIFKYQINEIPTSIYNTDAIIAKPYFWEKVKRKDKFIGSDLEMAEVDSLLVNMIKLPGLSANHNNLKQIIYCDVDMKEKKTSFKSNFSISGGLSTDVRRFYSELYKNKEMSDFYDALSEYEGDETALDIDTVTNIKLNNKKPFVYKIEAEGRLKNAITFLSDSMISITLDNLIQHTQIESEGDSTDLNYYLDYSYSDFYILVLNFPSNIEVLGIENSNKEIKNDYGEYLFNFIHGGGKQLTIRSYYRILKDMIPKDEFKQLKDINDVVQEIKNMRLLVKLKK